VAGPQPVRVSRRVRPRTCGSSGARGSSRNALEVFAHACPARLATPGTADRSRRHCARWRARTGTRRSTRYQCWCRNWPPTRVSGCTPIPRPLKRMSRLAVPPAWPPTQGRLQRDALLAARAPRQVARPGAAQPWARQRAARCSATGGSGARDKSRRRRQPDACSQWAGCAEGPRRLTILPPRAPRYRRQRQGRRHPRPLGSGGAPTVARPENQSMISYSS
jgi:hypothetical protein